MEPHKVMKPLQTIFFGALALSLPFFAAAAPLDDAYSYIDANKEVILKDWVDLVSIPAYSKNEQKRVEWLSAKMVELGLSDITVDSMLNVYGTFPGKSSDAPTLVVSAHTDTVFPMETPINPTIKDGKFHAPGSGDDASNVIGTLYALKAMKKAGLVPDVNIVFLGSSQEEIGLVGMKHFLNTYNKPIDMVIAMDSGLGSIAYGALGIQWFKVTFSTPSGHTLSSAGKPSAIKSLAATVDRLYREIPVNADDRTVMNVGTIGGGTVNNAIAGEAWFTIDLRSMNGSKLNSNIDLTKTIANEAASATGATMKMETLTEIPGGLLPNADTHKLTKAAVDSATELGIKSSLSPFGSCDSNASIAKGIYSIAMGVTKSSGGHSVNEYSEIEPMYTGIKWAIATFMKLK